MFQHALALHRQGCLEDAARNYESVLAAEPAHVDALVHLGALRLGQGRPAESEALLRRAATVADSAEVHANLAAALQALGRREDAVAHYQRAVALAPGMVDAQFGLAACLQALGRHADAIACYEAVLAVEPAHPEANFGLATLFADLDRADQAIERYRAALAADADFAEASYGLGTLLMQRGEVEEATACLRQALEVDPDYVEARLALAQALQRLERDDESIAAYQVVLEAAPDHTMAHHGLATILCRKHREVEAIQHFQIVLEREPEYVAAMRGMAGALMSAGRPAEAVVCCRQALDVDPDNIDARLALGLALQRLEHDDEAMEAFRAVIEVDPDRAMAHNGLAMILCRKQREAEAIPHFESALAREPEHVRSMAGMASALVTLGRATEAVALCHKAIATRPDYAPAISVLGRALAEVGNIEEAMAAARRAVALDPDRPELSLNLTQLVNVRRGDQVLDALEAMLPRVASFSLREQCFLYFALAKSYDDIGERDRGFGHLLEGNAIRRRLTEYDETNALAVMDRIRTAFTAKFMAARRDLGDCSTLPVFIVGMPRSGTTLVEQVLASHAAVFGAGERPELSQAVERLAGRIGALRFPGAAWTVTDEELRQIGAAYVAALQPLAPDAGRITDKMPQNFLFAGLIHLMLPRARIIHVIRDPVDTCLSCFSKLFGGELRFTYDLGELGRYHRAYQRLMAHWREVLPAHVLLEVQYENLVEDFEAEARRIVAHCGLPWDGACLEFHKTSRPVHTASVTQVRQPIYRSSVGRWRPEAALLRPLLEALGADSGRPA